MTRRLVVRYFGPGRDQIWTRLVNVLTYTAQKHCHGWQLDIAAIEPSEATLASPRGVQGYVWNTHKLDAWTRIVDEAPDGQELLLLDADTVILRPLDDVWARPFDIAYTFKPDPAIMPLNGGVVFVRATAAARAFMHAWREQNRFFLDNPSEFDKERLCGGVNQAALKVLLTRSHPAVIRKLPCQEWNCEDEHWSVFDSKVTRILHIKSHLQKAIFRMAKPEDHERPLVNLWRQLEAEYMDAARQSDRPVGPDRTTHVPSHDLTTPEAGVPLTTRAARRRNRRPPAAVDG